MGSSETPLDRRIDGIDRKIQECHKFLISTFQAESETLGEPDCGDIMSCVLNRDANETDYDAITERLEDEELSQVSGSDAYQSVGTLADLTE